MEVINALGRRKTSVARVYLQPGKGQIIVNEREFKDYFPSEILPTTVKQALTISKQDANYDVNVNVDGGGSTGQAEAIRLAIARALVSINNENRPALKKEGLMTRDSRVVERKKAGRRKARRRFQFSKR
ncbi:MAG: 30S ribosomal protein S9 [Flammeovirgaceae bacterium]